MKLARMQEQALLDLEVKLDLAHIEVKVPYLVPDEDPYGGLGVEEGEKAPSKVEVRGIGSDERQHHLELLAIYRRCGRRALEHVHGI
jgi:hypothetical protein